MRRMIPHNVWEQIKTDLAGAKSDILDLKQTNGVNPTGYTLSIASTDWDENGHVKFTRRAFGKTFCNVMFIGDGENLTSSQREAISNADLTVSLVQFAQTGTLNIYANGTVPEEDITLDLVVFLTGLTVNIPLEPDSE